MARLRRRWLDWLPIVRFVIADTSMRPALEPRERIIVLRRWPVRDGDIVVFRRPDQREPLVVKRVKAVTANGDLEVRGDNPNVSTDSRHFGPVPRALVVGKAVYRYLPGDRRGRL